MSAVGSTIGGVLSAQMIAAFGWHSVFILGGIAPLVVLVLLVVMLPESVRYLVARGAPAEKIDRIMRRLDPSIAAGGAHAYVLNEPRATGFPVRKLFEDGRARVTLLL